MLFLFVESQPRHFFKSQTKHWIDDRNQHIWNPSHVSLKPYPLSKILILLASFHRHDRLIYTYRQPPKINNTHWISQSHIRGTWTVKVSGDGNIVALITGYFWQRRQMSERKWGERFSAVPGSHISFRYKLKCWQSSDGRRWLSCCFGIQLFTFCYRNNGGWLGGG